MKRAIQIAAGLALFAYLQYALGIGRSVEAIRSARWSALLAGGAAFLLAHGIRLAKWAYFHRLAKIDASPGSVARFYFDLKLFGLVTPGRLGEFMPAFISAGKKGTLVSLTTFDRIAESFVTLVLALFAFAFVLKERDRLPLLPALLLVAFLLAAVVILLVRNEWMVGTARRAGGWLERFADNRFARKLLLRRGEIGREIEELRDSIRGLFRPPVAAVTLAITFIAVAADLLFWRWIFLSVGIDLSVGLLIGAVTLFNMSGFLSPTPAGFGVADALAVIFLRSAGKEGSFGSFLLLLRVVQFVFTVLPWILARSARAATEERRA